MMRSEAFRKRVVEEVRSGSFRRYTRHTTAWRMADTIAYTIRLFPVVAKDEPAKAALIRELLDISKQGDKAEKVLDRCLSKAVDALERLSVGQALMPQYPGESIQK